MSHKMTKSIPSAKSGMLYYRMSDSLVDKHQLSPLPFEFYFTGHL